MADPLRGSWLPIQLRALHYGSGCVEQQLLSSLPSDQSKAFIVTGNSLFTKTTLIAQVEGLLKEHHAGTFSKIGQHAPVARLDEATALILKDPNIDTVISVGGGSPIDSAKVISYRVKEKAGKFLHHITIPTTISAAECTGIAGYTNADGLKTGIKAQELVPHVILYDSSYALSTPEHLWSSTGIRALDHAMETMYHPDASELDRMMVLQAAAKLFKYLPLYVQNPKDEMVITELQLAAFASLGFMGNALNSVLGLSHTLGSALGSPYGIPHGLTSCITLGHVVKMKAQEPSAANQLVRMIPFVGLTSTGEGVSKDVEALGDKILQLVQELGLTTKLHDKGVGKDQILVIVKRATGDIESGPTFDKVAELVSGLF